MADDLTAIDMDTGCPTVFPGFPQLKLWPEAVVSLGETPETMPRLHPRFDKRARRAVRGFSHRLLPLKRIYLLTAGPAPRIETLRPYEALIGLVPHWYGFRFGDRLLPSGEASASQFRRCALLANGVTVRRLIRPRHLPGLGALLDLVEDDCAGDLEQALHRTSSA